MTSAILAVHVTPRSARDEIVGWQDGAVRVRLRAAPVEGQANEALRRLLAKHLGLSRSSVELIGGATSRHKRVRIEGISADEVRSRLA